MQNTGGGALEFEEVYRLHADGVYRFCLAQVRDAVAAEDLAADVFAAAFVAYERVRPEPSGVRAWLFRIARNAAIDRARRAHTRTRLFRLLRAETNHYDVERDAELRSDLRSTLDAIGRLSDRERLLVGLRIAAGLSYAEVAAVTGMKENAARMATTRALIKVRHEVERHE